MAKAAAASQDLEEDKAQLRDELKSIGQAKEGLEARMKQAEKFEMMYLDVVDREAKIQHLLGEAEERAQVLEEENLGLRMQMEAAVKAASEARNDFDGSERVESAAQTDSNDDKVRRL